MDVVGSNKSDSTSSSSSCLKRNKWIILNQFFPLLICQDAKTIQSHSLTLDIVRDEAVAVIVVDAVADVVVVV